MPSAVRRHADGHQHHVGLDGLLGVRALVLDAHPHAARRSCSIAFGAGVDQRLDALLLEGLRDLGGGLLVLERQHVRQHLDDRDLGAVRRGRRRRTPCRLRPRRRRPCASARVGQEQRLAVGDDALAVGLHARQRARMVPRRDDDVLRLDQRRRTSGRSPRARSAVALTSICLRRLQRRRALVDVDLVLAHQEADALDQAIAHLAAALLRDRSSPASGSRS